MLGRCKNRTWRMLSINPHIQGLLNTYYVLTYSEVRSNVQRPAGVTYERQEEDSRTAMWVLWVLSLVEEPTTLGSAKWLSDPSPRGSTATPPVALTQSLESQSMYVYVYQVASVMPNSFATQWIVAHHVPEILQARILEWVVMPFSRGSS